MHYTIYKTTNKINNNFYIGAHKTLDPYDDYLGSGKTLKKALKKYGIENFKKEVLFIFDNPEEMFNKEAELVNEEFIKAENTYNIKEGGFGGWDHFDGKGRTVSLSTRQKISAAKKKMIGELNSFYGKTHKEETKRKIGASSKIRAKSIYNQRMEKGNHPNSDTSCPHCGKVGQKRAMLRWHFNNCKLLAKDPNLYSQVQVIQ